MTPFVEAIFTYEKEKENRLAIIPLSGTREIADKIDYYLNKWFVEKASIHCKTNPKGTFLLKNQCPRFTTGDAKGMVYETVRGKDMYLLCDVGNYSIEYEMFGTKNRMSPDDHYADLKRIISAMAGKASKITVIMPLLYGGRQHRRNARESLDCSQMLHELYDMGVSDIITFDAHDPRVQNAVPLMGFDNFLPTYQILKALLKKYPNVKVDKNNFMVVSPDEGAMGRNMYYSAVLGVDLGMFYKRRDYSTIVNGRNPIVAHEYIGNDVKGKTVFVADDIIATGDSVLKLCSELKEYGASKIFLTATYALFTEGLKKFDDAYEQGLFTAVISTNLTYVSDELKQREWFICADLSKFLAYIIVACNQGMSLSELLDPHDKINDLIKKYNIPGPDKEAVLDNE